MQHQITISVLTPEVTKAWQFFHKWNNRTTKMAEHSHSSYGIGHLVTG
ncbi:hypothetical protein JTE90_003590, partial [Oedothorax gibbosus]